MAGNRWYDGSGHFMRGHHPLLAQLCRHTVNARRIAQLIEQCVKEKEFNRKEYGILLQLEAIESNAITRLSRSMRLTQQSIMRAETANHPKGQTKRPWDDED